MQFFNAYSFFYLKNYANTISKNHNNLNNYEIKIFGQAIYVNLNLHI